MEPGARFAVSDVIADLKMDKQAWTGCIAGALTEQEFRNAVTAAGLQDAEFRETQRVHQHAAAAIIRAREPLQAAS